MLIQDDFRALEEARGTGLISIYLPTARYGPEVNQGSIRLKRLLGEARERGAEAGLSPAELDERLAPVEARLGDETFWNHQQDGLAIFVGPDGAVEHRVPVSFDELVTAGERYDLRPVVPAVSRGRSFYILALSQKRVRLLEASIAAARELPLGDVPTSLEDAVGHDWEEESLQMRSGQTGGPGRQNATYHGHGDAGDRKDEIRKFLHLVDRGLGDHLEDRTAPIVVAAVDYLIPMFRQLSKLNVLPDGVEGSPDRLSVEELHEKALEVVGPHLRQQDRDLLDRLAETLHTGKAVAGLDEVLRTGTEARIATLFLDPSRELWGRMTNAHGEYELHEERNGSSEDLLDRALRLAHDAGAEVVPVSNGDLPDEAPVAALLHH
jgi:hypothetical protein